MARDSIRSEYLCDFGPDPEPLMAWLRGAVDQSIIDEISAADYHDCFEQCRAMLMDYQEHQTIPSLREWYPQEMLELIRWSEPHDPAWKPGDSGRRGFLMRTYACALLLRALADPKNDNEEDGSLNSTVAQFVAGVLELGEEVISLAIPFTASLIPRLGRDIDDRMYLLMGLMVLLLACRREKDLSPLVDALLTEMSSLHAQRRESHSCYLCELFSFDSCMKSDTWHILVDRYLGHPPKQLSESTRNAIRDLAAFTRPPHADIAMRAS